MKMHLGADVERPTIASTINADEQQVSQFTSGIMQHVAQVIGYNRRLHLKPKQYAETVHARLQRYGDNAGVTLQTLPIGSCSIDTDGSEYAAHEPTFRLYQHNIYNHQQQLICIAGAIAISRADEALATL